jgi:hypothetical protein
MKNTEKVESLVKELMTNLENLSIAEFLEMFHFIISKFDDTFNKYDLEKFKQALSDDKIRTFKDLL